VSLDREKVEMNARAGLDAAGMMTSHREVSNSSGQLSSGNSKPPQFRKRWSKEEDEILLDAVDKYGAKKWNKIAQELPNRNGHHARLRYYNYLRFSRDDARRPFTEAEDEAILRFAAQSDFHEWSKLAKEFNRGDNSVKNRYFLLRRREMKRREAEKNAEALRCQLAKKTCSSLDRVSIMALIN